MSLPIAPTPRPRIGISACLLGDEVRFDGGHKRNAFLTEALTPHVDWIRVCPEVEVGMGTPRETLRLVRGSDGSIRMMTTRTAIDHTDSMKRWSRHRLDRLEAERLSGYVLKKDSPSCGMEHVKVFDSDDLSRPEGRGLFADALIGRFPVLPIEDEGRLVDPAVREHFIERVFAYQRLQLFFEGSWTIGGLAAFHAAHEMTLLSHTAIAFRQLARLLDGQTIARDDLRTRYERGFMAALAIAATRGRHTRVLLKMIRSLEPHLDDRSMCDLRCRADDYRHGRMPLVAVLTRIRDRVRLHHVTPLMEQTYLELYPRELRLAAGA